MNVFISWSGPRSKYVAETLRDWLPVVINAVNPWLSAQDIDAGSRWSPEMADKLEQTSFGVLCLTAENLMKPWILYEAGALSKQVDQSRVVPYLIDIKPTDLTGPLAQFQAVRSTKDDTYRLVRSLNGATKEIGEAALEDSLLDKAFSRWWPDLEEELVSIPESETADQPERTTEGMMEEVLQRIRDLAHYQSRIDERLRSLASRVTVVPTYSEQSDTDVPSWLKAPSIAPKTGLVDPARTPDWLEPPSQGEDE